MTLEFFTYILALAYMLYKSGIIKKDQLKKLVAKCDEMRDKSIEDIIELLFLEVTDGKGSSK